MLLDLQKVPPEGQELDRLLARSALAIDSDDFRLARDVRLRGRLVPVETGVFRLSGALDTGIEVACVRCLESFVTETHEDLDLLFLPQAANVASGDVVDRELDTDELSVSFYRDEQIDLAHCIWEQILLGLPMKPLCKPECRGLCPSCGINRNSASCDCSPQSSDPRWEKLRSLL